MTKRDMGNSSPKASGNLGQPDKPEVTPSKPDWEYDEDGDMCPSCGGEGFIMESDGDPSDWGEDTFCGDEDSVIKCRHCNGTGIN